MGNPHPGKRKQWRWGSAWWRARGNAKSKRLLCTWPMRRARNWLTWVQQPQSEAELAALRRCVQRGRPCGAERWVNNSAARLGLGATLRPRGRPRKKET